MILTSNQFDGGGDTLPATPAIPLAPTAGIEPVKAAPKAAPTKAIDKSNWNRNIKVRQSTIDELKKGGIKSAAAMSKVNAGADQGGMVAEYQEATKRLYPKAYTAAPSKPTGGKVKPTGGRVDNKLPVSPYGFGGFTQTPNKAKPTAKPKPTMGGMIGTPKPKP
jgi:hypothetical protein